MTELMESTEQSEKKIIIFQELRRVITGLEDELAKVYPDREARRRKVFELLGSHLGNLQAEQVNLPGEGENSFLPLSGVLGKYVREEPDLIGEVLGHVLETLIREDEGKQAGTFYTSRDVVTLMCRLALWNYLGHKIDEHGVNWEDMGRLVFRGEYNVLKATHECKAALLTLLRQVRIIDPAVGSGAFLLGMLEELTALRVALGEKLPAAAIRQQVIGHNIFGVDREAAAVEVVKLRLSQGKGPEFGPEFNHGLVPRVVCGDSLFLDWERHFPEVMAGGGFDIILANPPYVSQDRLEISYKDRLANTYGPKGLMVERKADLYVYFYALAEQILNAGGTAVLITSTAWLDVDYGTRLQKFLLDNFALPLIMDSSIERWFGEAAVNTAITVLNRGCLPDPADSSNTAFVNLQQGLYQMMLNSGELLGDFLEELARALKGVPRSCENTCLRVNAVSCTELSNDDRSWAVSGPNDWSGPTKWSGGTNGSRGTKWGKYLRATGVYFRLLDYSREKLSCLGDIATIKRGFTTGCNEFFYIRAGQDLTVEARYLKPVIKSPRETLGFIVDEEKLKYQVALITEAEHCWGKATSDYIKWGENQGYHKRQTLTVRNPWWQLQKTEFPVLIFRRFFNEKFNLPYLPVQIAEDQTFYGVYYQGDPLVLAAIMNSTLTWLFIELHGRTALGEGVLQYAVYEAAGLPVINPERLGIEARQSLREIFKQMGKRQVLELEQELASPDRRLLDSILIRELGIQGEVGNLSLQDELYRDFLQLVRDRLQKAKN